jgi:hypothetical protein
MIRLAKWSLVALCGVWAVYSLWGIWGVTQAFRSSPAEHIAPLTNLMSGLQLVAVTLGPLAVAVAFLFVRWPRGSGNSN